MPQLAPVVDKLEDVPEPARQFYVQKEGKFHVDLNGSPAGYVPAADLAAANGKVVEFRDTNIALTKKVSEMEPRVKAFEGLDPDAAKTAIAKVTELEKKGVKGADDVAKLVTDGIAAAMKPVQDQLALMTTSAAETQRKNDELTLRSSLSDKFTKAGGLPDALDFIVGKTKGVFKVENGVIKAEANQFSTDKPGEPLSVDEWITKQTKEAAFAFKPSSGSGANPVPAGGAGAKPGQLVIKDPTPQQLGEHASDIKAGKVRVEYSEKTTA